MCDEISEKTNRYTFLLRVVGNFLTDLKRTILKRVLGFLCLKKKFMGWLFECN